MNERFGLLQRLAITQPIIQAPMAGIATPALAAAVCEAGGLGSLGLAGTSPNAAWEIVRDLTTRTARSFALNLFCAPSPTRDTARESAWIERLTPHFPQFGSVPPVWLEPAFRPSPIDEEMLKLLLEVSPRAVSFHLGLPARDVIATLKWAGIVVMATATSVERALEAEAAGADAVVAQGIAAGGHRGLFSATDEDEQLVTRELVEQLVPRLAIPVIAAGGIMDGADLAAMLRIGAAAGQLGTAFLGCPEAQLPPGYRAALFDEQSTTEITRGLSGWPARAISNRLTAIGRGVPARQVPAFPLPLTLSRALAAAAAEAGESGYGIFWAGAELRRLRALPASELMQALVKELEADRSAATINA
ncbi:nitronate monooxygenase [Bosea caraganae]|uniref:Propionate 3-nitronate monooxygenase n=1 Tax=Bosea caraganae TaxID=2763117 RepID=A0A370L9T0_9HYPH|nr:nitronate monooxygenase [Bosea caraganae]RDJ22037.1 nitronate monooxygenase [Bosea caraganae]RDJ27930.1 nitronate monooxygenase [Bosea caraganae]